MKPNYKEYSDKELDEITHMGLLDLTICQGEDVPHLLATEVERVRRREQEQRTKYATSCEKELRQAFSPVISMWNSMKDFPVLAPNGVDILPASCWLLFTGESNYSPTKLDFMGPCGFLLEAVLDFDGVHAVLKIAETEDAEASPISTEDALAAIIRYFAPIWRPDASYRIDGRRISFDQN